MAAFITCTPSLTSIKVFTPLSHHGHSKSKGKRNITPSHFTMATPSSSSRSSSTDRRTFLSTSVSLSAAAVTFLLAPKETLADYTYASARRSFDRYHPRILSSIETIRAVGTAISIKDNESISKLINNKVFNVKGKHAFTIYAGVFSDNYVTNTTRKMVRDTDSLFSELEQVALGGDDMMEHYEKALIRLTDYYKVGRLPMSELGNLKVDNDVVQQ